MVHHIAIDDKDDDGEAITFINDNTNSNDFVIAGDNYSKT